MSRGHYCIFLPKYHPELNFIERYWSRVKWYARQKCDQTKDGLRTATEEALSKKDRMVKVLQVCRCAALPVCDRACMR